MVVHMRHTRGHTANRRSHHALKGARFVVCAKCNAKHLMHRVCQNCGTYRGRTVVDTMKKVMKAEKKAGHTHNTTKPEGEAKSEKKKEKPAKKTKKEEVAA